MFAFLPIIKVGLNKFIDLQKISLLQMIQHELLSRCFYVSARVGVSAAYAYVVAYCCRYKKYGTYRTVAYFRYHMIIFAVSF